MPTYEYACRECDHQFELFQSMNAESLTRCPECERDTLRRLIGRGAGIIFKGSGFYETDYRREASSAPAGEPSSGEKAATAEKPATGEKPAANEKSSKEASPPPSPASKTPSASTPATT
ncbi:MAG: FmdB family zinc ribbon protein [Opitutales bacterium]